jgi:hypothetical protein
LTNSRERLRQAHEEAQAQRGWCLAVYVRLTYRYRWQASSQVPDVEADPV